MSAKKFFELQKYYEYKEFSPYNLLFVRLMGKKRGVYSSEGLVDTLEIEEETLTIYTISEPGEPLYKITCLFKFSKIARKKDKMAGVYRTFLFLRNWDLERWDGR